MRTTQMSFARVGLAALSFLTFPTASMAQDATTSGFILNINSKKCAYTQAETSENFFYKSAASQTRTIVFDDPSCMLATGVDGKVNESMIAAVVASQYSHSDAAFETKVGELRPPAQMQTVGSCIQSATYPIIGVAFFPVISGGYITGAKHASTISGCR